MVRCAMLRRLRGFGETFFWGGGKRGSSCQEWDGGKGKHPNLWPCGRRATSRRGCVSQKWVLVGRRKTKIPPSLCIGCVQTGWEETGG